MSAGNEREFIDWLQAKEQGGVKVSLDSGDMEASFYEMAKTILHYQDRCPELREVFVLLGKYVYWQKLYKEVMKDELET